jgi:drug/metabolite transporter (DMT)-like permease
MKQSGSISHHETRGLILAIASVVCFSATSLLLSFINSQYGVDGWVASAYRGTIGLTVIITMQAKAGKLHLSHIFTNRLLFLRGLIGGATIPMYYICIMELGPGRAGMISGSYPLFAAIFALVLIKEALSRSYYVYILLALAGLVAVFSESGIGGGKPLFDLLAMTGAAAAGFCVVMIRHLRHSESTSTIFASQCLFTLIITLPFAWDRLFTGSPAAIALTLLAAIIVVCGQLCITESFRHISVAQGSTLQMLTPASTVILSALLLGEHFSPIELAGGITILFASYRIAVRR